MMKKLIVSLLLLAAGLATGCATRTTSIYNVKDYGAIGDGVALNTKALQATIDACADAGGGVVLVPAGQYVTGTIKLKSNIELRLEPEAELLGSLSLDDYARDIQGAIEAPAFDECLVYAENANNIRITGGGTINGRGHRENFPVGERTAYHDRPMLIRFVDCVGVHFEDVTFKNAASWCTHLVDCDNIVARNVTIDSVVNRNNDGFDLDGCKNVLIEDCDIRTGDDSICPKSTTTRVVENVVVRNTRAISHTSAFKLGTSSRGGFKNILVTDCDFSGTRMGAIKLLAVDGGFIEDVRISNIVMDDVEGPIFIRLANRGRTYEKPTEQIQAKDVEPEGAPVGYIKGIHISDIKATVSGDKLDRQGMMISGIPGHMIEDVLLENIEISYPGGGTAEQAQVEVAEDIARYPEQFFFGVLPSWGLYIRHAKNVEFKNVNMSTRALDARPKFVQVNVENFVSDEL
ncbi:glycoside hydrolase family 28 protein [Coraliomargarita sp. SDUM461004]|uniref:Glycoside hydrolase family 28 protein n=1 Tax=Thalassobacterium sedimentorum TaxID=3041258 RepID=A0ABU1ALG5_9BACT|nr:glycoside hydrolase family 28 protein [Coraliomargarita sp. SDUM461004]MDQ8195628.1 glycoside hydrolase family 28 protein [Coraliomargarita sp. SDUM461004]